MSGRRQAIAYHLRRAIWHARWRVRASPIVLDPWVHGLRIALPRTGTAAQIYYRGLSDPLLAAEVRAGVPPGGCYVDVGAHVGEYVLLAAGTAGARGTIVAVEPNPVLAEALEANVVLNTLSGVRVRRLAVGANSGRVRFAVDERSGGGWVGDAGATTYVVDGVTLTELAESEHLDVIDAAKIDAGGAEADVIRGAAPLIADDRLPLVFVKLYHREVVRQRFGGDSLDLVEALLAGGYALEVLAPEGRREIRRAGDLGRASEAAYGVVLVATRRGPAPPRLRR